MADPVLLVAVNEVAEWLELDPVELSQRQKNVITRRIVAAQNKVATYLNRPSLVATDHTLTELYRDDRYPQTDVAAWPEAARYFDDRYKVKTVAQSATDPDLYDVTFTVGLDVAGDPECGAILDFILQDVLDYLTASPFMSEIKRVVRSVSAEGQSVSYESRPAGPGQAGAPVTLTNLVRFKRFAVGTATPDVDPRPYPYRG